MNRLSNVCLPLALLLSLVTSLPVLRPASVAPHGAGDDDLAAVMEMLKEQLKETAMATASEDLTGALVHVAELERYVLQAKLLDPANLESVAEDKRDAHRAQFRSELVVVLRELADMELDLLAGNGKTALARIMGPLLEMREGAHERYQKSK